MGTISPWWWSKLLPWLILVVEIHIGIVSCSICWCDRSLRILSRYFVLKNHVFLLPKNSHQFGNICFHHRCLVIWIISSTECQLAYKTAMIAHILAPLIWVGMILCSSSALITPIWLNHLAHHHDKQSQIFLDFWNGRRCIIWKYYANLVKYFNLKSHCASNMSSWRDDDWIDKILTYAMCDWFDTDRMMSWWGPDPDPRIDIRTFNC